MRIGRATVFGGSGFIGRHIVQRLAKDGTVVRIAVRDPESALELKPLGAVGQIVPAYASVRDPESIMAAVHGADVVVNAVGLYVPRGRNSYQAIHVEGAAAVAKAAADAGARRLVHLSGLGADASSNNAYIRARGEGDAAVRQAFPDATLLQPSAVFGPGDHLLSNIGNMARFAPIMPLFGGGGAKLQPVYVGDVADAAHVCLTGEGHAGKTYELGGPQVYSYRQLFRMIDAATDRDRPVMAVPMWTGRILAFFGRLMPNPPVTKDMLYLMSQDNVATEDGLAALGLTAQSLESILPTVMDAYRRGGRWKNPRMA